MKQENGLFPFCSVILDVAIHSIVRVFLLQPKWNIDFSDPKSTIYFAIGQLPMKSSFQVTDESIEQAKSPSPPPIPSQRADMMDGIGIELNSNRTSETANKSSGILNGSNIQIYNICSDVRSYF